MSEELERYKTIQAARKRRSRSICYNREFVPEGSPYERYRWVERISSGLRFVGKAHEIDVDGYPRPITKHSGWYLDDFQDETCWGVVVQLPARNRKPRFVSGYQSSWDDADSAVLDFHWITEDLAQAIQNADSMAGIMAEAEREYQRKEQILTEIEDLQGRRIQLRKLITTRIKDWRAFQQTISGASYDTLFGVQPVTVPATVTLAFKQGVQKLRTQMHEDWKSMKKLKEDL